MDEAKTPETSEKAPKKKPVSPYQGAYDWLESIVSAIVICILLFLFAFRVVSVDGTSMVPTLENQDKVLISRFCTNPKRGDIVVLTKYSFSDESIVKRVIATEGQTVEIDFTNGIVYVDGEAQEEPYIAELTHRELDMAGPVTVEKGCIFCLGDNRNASTDSRSRMIGQIDTRCVLGKVLFRVWPLSSIGVIGGNG